MVRYGITRVQRVNSLWPSDAIWRQGSGSTLAQVMACCLTAPSHYLNQCWLIICGVLHHSPEVSSTGNAYESNHYNAFENYLFKIKVTIPRVQWGKHLNTKYTHCIWSWCAPECRSYKGLIVFQQTAVLKFQRVYFINFCAHHVVLTFSQSHTTALTPDMSLLCVLCKEMPVVLINMVEIPTVYVTA